MLHTDPKLDLLILLWQGTLQRSDTSHQAGYIDKQQAAEKPEKDNDPAVSNAAPQVAPSPSPPPTAPHY